MNITEFGSKVLDDIDQAINSGKFDYGWIIYKLETFERLLSTAVSIYPICEETINKIASILNHLQRLSNHQQNEPSEILVTLDHVGERGRPRILIDIEKLHYLLSLNFTATDIAKFFGTSRYVKLMGIPGKTISI